MTNTTSTAKAVLHTFRYLIITYIVICSVIDIINMIRHTLGFIPDQMELTKFEIISFAVGVPGAVLIAIIFMLILLFTLVELIIWIFTGKF